MWVIECTLILIDDNLLWEQICDNINRKNAILQLAKFPSLIAGGGLRS